MASEAHLQARLYQNKLCRQLSVASPFRLCSQSRRLLQLRQQRLLHSTRHRHTRIRQCVGGLHHGVLHCKYQKLFTGMPLQAEGCCVLLVYPESPAPKPVSCGKGSPHCSLSTSTGVAVKQVVEEFEASYAKWRVCLMAWYDTLKMPLGH